MTRPVWWRGDDPGRRLEGKRAFVTGAGTGGGDLLGIGEAIAVLFAAQGAQVAIAAISAERADAARALIDDLGGRAVVTVGDLTSQVDNARCVQQAVDAFGGLDTIVNNAALAAAGGGSPVDMDLDGWTATMELNLGAALLTARNGIPHLRAAGGGSIVNISSIAASRGMGGGAYAASKAALGGLTRDWAYLHGRDGIRCNCILPGHAHTPMGSDTSGPEAREHRRLAGLLGTEGTAWDIAWAAVFLASEESRWITGVELPVDAGATATTSLPLAALNAR